ncbi:TetR family transcriptional regulator [Aureimonas altamirensis]|uniref:TetR/AcrR family transcriptional regulator n=1 Tax=Aureimonas altamirensis TaxID=370622 RepID=UPI001E538B6D|nr:TetR/AcrR family transcriptional regulator [Aureimonas altamirensis]UHD45757.1 TetR family transcriptional regulator [Aureimonas altamirensis]
MAALDNAHLGASEEGMERHTTDAGDMLTRILDTAELLLRRHGPDKLTVIDVARVMDMSHGNVYRHISSKAALRAAVIERWLGRVAEQTEAIAEKKTPADIRLEDWLIGLARIKQRKVVDDAELLLASAQVVRENPAVEHGHSARLTAQVVKILEDGLKDGTLPGVGDSLSTATAVLNATFRFHHPDLVAIGGAPEKQMAALNNVVSLIVAGLKRTSPSIEPHPSLSGEHHDFTLHDQHP